MSADPVLTTREGGVSTITLNRPDKLNALSPELLGGLREALQSAADDEQCRCVLLTGSGRAFCSGADLSAAPPPAGADGRIDFGAPLEMSYHPVLRLMRSMGKPVVAAVNGVAAGAGCNIALAADVVVAARSAHFIQAFIRIGLVPDAGGTWVVPRLIGRARAMRWMMSGEALDADTALQWGLIAHVHDDASLHDAAVALAQRMAAQPTVALAAIRQLVDEGLRNDFETQLGREAAMQTQVGYSRDTLEGIAAFIEKRKARFEGR